VPTARVLAVDVEHFDLAAVLPLVTVGCIVSIDVAKTKFVAAIATAAGDVQKLVKFEQSRQTAAFLGLLRSLQQAERRPVVVMRCASSWKHCNAKSPATSSTSTASGPTDSQMSGSLANVRRS
jgi:hypothetical protein